MAKTVPSIFRIMIPARVCGPDLGHDLTVAGIAGR